MSTADESYCDYSVSIIDGATLPAGAKHKYTITLYALSSTMNALPTNDDIKTDWTDMTAAMEGKIIDSSYFSFFN